MHPSMRRHQRGSLVYYTCDRLPVRHAFFSRLGGVSTGHCQSLNFGFSRGDDAAAVRQNYRIAAEALAVPYERITLTHQVHQSTVTRVNEDSVGTGLARPMDWDTDALVTNLADTPLVGFYADCIVTLFYAPDSCSIGVCHTGWRGLAAGALQKTAARLQDDFGADPKQMIAVMGPSIHQQCFETDADVPEALEQQLGTLVQPFIASRGAKFYVDLQGIGAALLQQAGLPQGNIVDSGLCTRCRPDEFWSHRYTNGVRGVGGGLICL